MRKRREMIEGVICIFYVRISVHIAKITLKSVLMKKTKIEHHKTHDKKDDRLVA